MNRRFSEVEENVDASLLNEVPGGVGPAALGNPAITLDLDAASASDMHDQLDPIEPPPTERIPEVDYASSVTDTTSQQVLGAAAQAALTQANEVPSTVATLLANLTD